MIVIKNKILLILAVVLLGFDIIYTPVQADSGWDSDYDSGWDSDYDSGWDSDYDSGWDSGSDWSSSDWDSDSDWSSSDSYYSSGYGGGLSFSDDNMTREQICIWAVLFFGLFIFIFISSIVIRVKKNISSIKIGIIIFIWVIDLLLLRVIFGVDASVSIWSIIFSPIIMIIIIVNIVLILIYFRINKKRKKNNRLYKKNNSESYKSVINIINYNDIDINKIKKIDPGLDINEFKTKVFNIYKDIQIAWMNFDTDTIRKLTTDEVYNMYSSQLETLKLKKQKNIMKDIELIDVKITDIRKENNIIKINTYLNVRCYDYVIKEDTNEVVRGRDNAKINIKYMLTFVKSSDNNKLVEKCPNCGASVDIVSSAECPYCDSTLVKASSDYVMSKKISLGQTFEK